MEALSPDRRLGGRYVLEDRVAPGGMATVWRAHDDVLARTVAVKCLRDDLSRDPEFAERFQREAINAARLNHPNVISIFDTGVDDGIYFIVMEYFPGRTLRQALAEKGSFDPQTAVSLILPVVSALGFAHSNGVIHRDVKPGNILLSDDGRVKVADFGIAKAAFAGGDLTTTGNVLGTVQYLSPEQVQGGELDIRSDLYSVGVVLYETVTGRVPFVADSHVATAMMRLTQDPVPPSALRSGIPRELDAVIMRAMARRPEDRFSSAESLHAALERFVVRGDPSATRPIPVTAVEEEPQPVVPSRSSMFRSWMLVPLMLLLLGAGVIAGGLALGRLKLGGPFGVRVVPTGTPQSAATAQVVRITDAQDYDPQGDGSEHPSEVRRAFDRNPSTSWSTDHYNSAPFGGLGKKGVGLWIALDRAVRIRQIRIQSTISDWTFEIKRTMDAAAQPIAATNGDPSFSISGGSATVDLQDVQSQGFLIWITQLGPSGGKFAADISEVAVTAAPA